MFLFSSKESFSISAFYYAFATNAPKTGSAMLHLFDGTPPESINDLPFDIKDPFEMQKHTVASQQIDVERVSENSKHYWALTGDMEFGTYIHGFSPKWRKWHLVPRRSVPLKYWTDELEPQLLDPASYDDDENTLRKAHWLYRYDLLIRRYDEHMIKSNSNYGGSVIDDSSPSGHMFIYDQPVTINQMVLKTWTNAGNVPNLWTIQAWDETLNDGNGGWYTAVDQYNLYDTVYSTQMYFEFPDITSTRFKVIGNGPGGTFAMNQIQFYGNEPDWGKDSRTVTWALMLPERDTYSGYYPKISASSFAEPDPGYPAMLLNVGKSGDNSGAPLEFDTLQATNLDIPRLQRGFIDIDNTF